MVSRTAWYPIRHGIPHGTVSRTAWYPARHGTPYGMVSQPRTACYLTRHGIPRHVMVDLQFVAERVDLALTHVPDLHVLAKEAALKPLLRIVQTRRGFAEANRARPRPSCRGARSPEPGTRCGGRRLAVVGIVVVIGGGASIQVNAAPLSSEGPHDAGPWQRGRLCGRA